MSVVGHKRHIRRVRATSAFPPLATKLLRYGNRRSGPYPEVLLRRQPEFSELSRAFQFEVRSTNLCAEGLSRNASANHATDCFAAASAACREEYSLPE